MREILEQGVCRYCRRLTTQQRSHKWNPFVFAFNALYLWFRQGTCLTRESSHPQGLVHVYKVKVRLSICMANAMITPSLAIPSPLVIPARFGRQQPFPAAHASPPLQRSSTNNTCGSFFFSPSLARPSCRVVHGSPKGDHTLISTPIPTRWIADAPLHRDTFSCETSCADVLLLLL